MLTLLSELQLCPASLSIECTTAPLSSSMCPLSFTNVSAKVSFGDLCWSTSSGSSGPAISLASFSSSEVDLTLGMLLEPALLVWLWELLCLERVWCLWGSRNVSLFPLCALLCPFCAEFTEPDTSLSLQLPESGCRLLKFFVSSPETCWASVQGL